MESVYITDYKDVLISVAQKLRIQYMSTDIWGASGNAEMPALFVSVDLKKDAARIKKEFKDEVRNITGEYCLFGIHPKSPRGVLRSNHVVFYKEGQWIDVVY